MVSKNIGLYSLKKDKKHSLLKSYGGDCNLAMKKIQKM